MRLVAIVAAALLALAGCGGGDAETQNVTPTSGSSSPAAGGPDERIKVVAVTDVYGDIARTIGGEHVDVTSIISGAGADPHSYEASARDELAVRNASLVIANGGGYDEFLERMLDATHVAQRTVLTAVTEAHHEDEGAAAAASSPAPHDHGPDGNEHVWYDLKAMRVVADDIADFLSDRDPRHRGEYQSNAETFRTGIESLMRRQAAIREAHGGTPVAITEPVPLYLLGDCGLVDKTPAEFSEAIEEGNDVPVRVLQQTLDLFADHVVKVLVYNSQTTGPQTQRVEDAADDADVPVVPMSETLPSGQHYLDWMAANLDALEAALGGASPGPSAS